MIPALGALALVAGLLLMLMAASRPDHYRVTRTTVIKAPAATVFALINDLKSFHAWSVAPGQKPTAGGHYSGAAAGVGAACSWDGRKHGARRMEITASEPGRRVTMRLDIATPAAWQQTAEFTLQPQGEHLTIVSWALRGPSSFMSRVKGLVVDLDTVIGRDLEAGLANLRALAESRRPAR
jgi:uncharacterized protein YndB with AHSA1/START domain